MTPEIANLLIQIPIVAAFIWFVLTWSQRNQQAMDKHDQEMRAYWGAQREYDRAVLEKLTASVEKLCEMVEAHDAKMDKAIVRMEERTAKHKPLTAAERRALEKTTKP